MLKHLSIAFLVAVPLCASASPLPLVYNWNGMVHTGEMGAPDAPDGYRSISDRGLTVGVDANSLTPSLTGNTGLNYAVETSASVVDTIFLGLRAAWDPAPDPDDHGIRPSWDPTGGTAALGSWTSLLPAPVAVTSDFNLGLLYNISNGGAEFDVTLLFGVDEVSVTLAAPDWFGLQAVPAAGSGVATQALLNGPVSGETWGGVQARDVANFGPPLNLVEATITADSLLADLGFDVHGRSLTGLRFDNLTGIDPNLREGALGIYAAALTVPEPNVLAMLGIGLAGLGLTRKRSTRAPDRSPPRRF